MILSQPEVRAAVAAGEIKFDPPLEEQQWGEASIDLRLGIIRAKSCHSNPPARVPLSGRSSIATCNSNPVQVDNRPADPENERSR